MKILLIEDNPHDAELVRHALAGYQLHLATNLPDGLQFLQQHPDTECVLCDLKMPPEAFGDIAPRTIRRISNVAIVLLTGSHDDSIIDSIVPAVAEGYASKHLLGRKDAGDRLTKAITEAHASRALLNTCQRACQTIRNYRT